MSISRFTRWFYTDSDPEGLGLLEELRLSEDCSAPERVWRAVLLQAKREARYTGQHWEWARNYARRWIFHGGPDFLRVCRWAGVQAGDFQSKVRREI